MKVIAVIPARYAAVRFPGKPLALIHGKPMIQWVYERASKTPGVDQTLVATDDNRIFNAVNAFGGQAVMTSEIHASGTDRIAEVADKVIADIYINVQGDEPLIKPAIIEAALDLVRTGRFEMSTLAAPLINTEELHSKNVVKVLMDRTQRAIYFSRFPIPYSRTEPVVTDSKSQPSFGPVGKHIGLYVYRREILLKLRDLPRSALEIGEGLEQLRALEHGISIGVQTVQMDKILGVDTPEDLEKIKEWLDPNG